MLLVLCCPILLYIWKSCQAGSFMYLVMHSVNIYIYVPGTVLGTQSLLKVRLSGLSPVVCIGLCFLTQLDPSMNLNLKNH